MTVLVLALRGAAAIAVLTTFVGGVPRIVRLGLAVATGLWSAMMVGTVPEADGIVLMAASELAIGAAVGLVAAVPLMAAATAGLLVDLAGGARGAYGAMLSVVAAAVFVGIDGHVAAIGAIGESFRAVPVAGVQVGVREAVGGLIGAAVKLAIPWLVTAAVVEIAVGVGVRVAGRAALQAPVGAAVPAAMAMMTAALVGTFAVGVAALVR
jgi:flagellar biosynthesis protein FliR